MSKKIISDKLSREFKLRRLRNMKRNEINEMKKIRIFSLDLTK